MSWVTRTIVVKAADQALAQQLCAGIAGPAGQGMFTTPLSPSGTSPATHYITSGKIDSQFDAALHDANIMYAAAQAAVPPVAVTLAQCQTLIADSTVIDMDAGVPTLMPDGSTVNVLEGPFATMARLGLKLIQPSTP